MTKEERLAELKSKETLTNAEMDELTQLSPAGTFKSLPNVLTIGVKNVDGFFANLIEGAEISQKAFENGSYIETISLRLQHIELYLRMYVVFKNKKGKILDAETDKRTFGNYVNDCEQLGFDSSLILELKDFNNYRVKAIHKYILGEIRYSDLKDVCVQTHGLDARIRQYVIDEVGTVI
jgi:hypothetical protein